MGLKSKLRVESIIDRVCDGDINDVDRREIYTVGEMVVFREAMDAIEAANKK